MRNKTKGAAIAGVVAAGLLTVAGVALATEAPDTGQPEGNWHQVTGANGLAYLCESGVAHFYAKDGADGAGRWLQVVPNDPRCGSAPTNPPTVTTTQTPQAPTGTPQTPTGPSAPLPVSSPPPGGPTTTVTN